MCTDVDASDTMDYTIAGAPSTITISGTTISGTPVNADVGTHTITVTCTDGAGATASDAYVLTVTNVNDAPTVASAIADASTNEDAAYSLSVSGMCTDVDSGDGLAYSISGAPNTITISGTTISGTPVNANVGTHTITVTCTDDAGATASDSYVLTVVDVNDGPSFTSSAVTSATEDTGYAYVMTATDPESQAITITGTTIPSWTTLVDLGTGTAVLSGTPENGDVGTHAVVLTATDASSTTTTQTFTITVANSNDAPTLASTISDVTNAEDVAYSLSVSGLCTDVDASDTMDYTISGAPSTITISGTTISGTPVNADVGTHTITVTCTDGAGATASDAYVLTVTNVNDAPDFTSTAATAATEDAAYSYTVTATDVDTGDSATLAGTTVPSWLTFTAATGVLAGTPTNAEVGLSLIHI